MRWSICEAWLSVNLGGGPHIVFLSITLVFQVSYSLSQTWHLLWYIENISNSLTCQGAEIWSKQYWKMWPGIPNLIDVSPTTTIGVRQLSAHRFSGEGYYMKLALEHSDFQWSIQFTVMNFSASGRSKENRGAPSVASRTAFSRACWPFVWFVAKSLFGSPHQFHWRRDLRCTFTGLSGVRNWCQDQWATLMKVLASQP